MDHTPMVTVGGSSIEDAIDILGGFHLFQWIIVGMFSFMSPPRVFQVVFMVFGGRDPPWKCSVNSTLCTLNGTQDSLNRERCLLPRIEWEYSVPKETSLTAEFDLVCDREWMRHLLSSAVFIGWGVGALVLGWVADNYGRKFVLFPSQLMLLICGISFSFVKSVPLLVFLRFLTGVFVPPGTVQCFIIISEYVSSKHRPLATLILFFSFTISSSILPLYAYYVRDWRLLSIVISAPYIVTLLPYFFVPESIRWVRLKGTENQLSNILKRVAYWNGRDLPADLRIKSDVEEITLSRKYSIADVFRTPIQTLRSIVLGYSWLANGMVFYSLLFAAGDIGGSLYINFFLLCVLGIPGNAGAIHLCNKIGRKKSNIISLFITSCFCFAVAWIPKENAGTIARIICALIGLLFSNISFSSIYVWSVEVYPTTTRSNAMGFLQVTSRIGAASAPWVSQGLLTVHPAAPYLVMSGVAFIASFVLLVIPETKGKVMIETEVEVGDDGEGIGVGL